VKPVRGMKGRLTAVREVVEEEGGKIEEWDKEDYGRAIKFSGRENLRRGWCHELPLQVFD